MTLDEFWKIVDDIDIESREDGRYTSEEIYKIGCAFVKLKRSDSFLSVAGIN